jgi:SAM-dependent methyltransferase
MSKTRLEARRPPTNKAPRSSALSQIEFAFRRFLDLQVHTVLRDITPWLATRHGSVLDVGCGDQPYRRLIPKDCKYFGLDWDGSKAEFSVTENSDVTYFNGGKFPFPENCFDSVFHTEVLEHVKDTDLFLQECRRVLKPGGEMMLTVPFQARYHFIPFDYWRFTPSGLTEVLERAGFSNLRISPRGSDVAVAAYKVVGVFFRLAFDGIVGKVIFVLFSWLVVLLLVFAHASIIFGFGSTDDCLGYSVTASS